MTLRQKVHDSFFWFFNKHIYSAIPQIHPFIAKRIVRYGFAKRLLTEFPFTCSDGRPLVFIHIPKCGGTSVARAFGLEHIRHFPVSFYHLFDGKKFKNCRTFAIVRHPIDRLISLLLHYRSSEFASPYEIKLFKDYGINEHNLESFILPLLSEKSFYRKFFIGTRTGRNGFSVNQAEYLTFRGKLMVDNLFTIEKMDVLGRWLSRQLGRNINIGHSNSSGINKKRLPSTEILKAAQQYIWTDFLIYNTLCDVGGYALEGTPELDIVKDSVKR